MAAKFWLILALLLWLVGAGVSIGYAQTGLDSAPPPLILTDDQGQYSLGRHLELLEDSSGQLTLADVSSPEFDSRFTPSQTDAPSFGLTQSAIWARLRLRNQTALTANWLLEIVYPTLDQVELYFPVPSGTGFERKQAGFTLPFADRDIPHHKLLFNLSLPPQAEQVLYLRFQNQTSLFLTLTLWAPLHFMGQDHTDQFIWGIYYGVLLMIAGYNLFLFVALRERSYLYLVLFISFLLLGQAISSGRAQEYLWGELGRFYHWLGLLASLLTVIFLLKFTGAFLETRQRMPGLHRLINFWITALLVCPLTALLFGFQAALIALLLLILPILLTLIWAGLVAWKQGFRPARYFVLAEGIPLLLAIFEMIARLNLIPPLPWLREMVYAGNVLLVLFLSLALADRINLLKAETEAINHRLKANERRFNQFLNAVPVGVAVQDKHLNSYYVNQKAQELLDLPSIYKASPRLSPGQVAAQLPVFRAGTDDLYPVENLPLSRALQGQPVTADDLEVVVNQQRIRLEVWSSPIFDEQEQLVYVISAFNDITERKKQEAELARYRDQLAQLVEARTWELLQSNQALRQQRALAESLGAIAAALNRSLDQEIVLTEVLRLLKQVVAYEGAAVWLSEGETFSLVKTAGVTELDLRQGDTLTDLTALVTKFQPKPPYMLDPSHIVTWENDQPERYWLGAPLWAGQQVIGVLVLKKGQTTFTEDELKALHAFADYTAVAVVNARLYQQAQATATTRERERLARELHDAVTQTLFAASLIAEALPQLWSQAPPAAIQNVEKLRQLTRGALAEMRSLLLELRPTTLLEARLENLLTHLSEAMAVRTRVSVNFEIEGDFNGALPPEVKVTYYRIAQEAFNNITKHAHATEIKMVLRRQPPAWWLQITDNGRGFEASAASAEQMGLTIMRERAAAIGAALCIDSRPGQGTEVALQWPAQSEEF
jgi:signal transduction histidine kinase